MGWKNTSLWVLVVAVVTRVALNGLDSACQPKFKVHQTGGVVITGASSGIGEDAAVRLSEMGYTVFAGVRKEADSKALSEKFPKIVPVILDVTKEDSINSAASGITKLLSAANIPLVAVINNAGVQKDMPVELQASESNRFNFEVNVFGLFDVTRAFLPLLRKTGDGARIVNIGSLAGVVAGPGSASYSASKFAVEGITDSLRLEVADMGISVSLLQPGYVKSKMGGKAHVDSEKSYGVSAEEYSRYRETVFEGFFAKDKALTETAAAPAETTTPAIVDAITSPTPKTRYAVAYVDDGLPAWLVISLRGLLSDRVWDVIMTM